MSTDWSKYPLWPDTMERHTIFLKAKHEYATTGSDDALYEMQTMFQICHGDLKCARACGRISPALCEELTTEMRDLSEFETE